MSLSLKNISKRVMGEDHITDVTLTLDRGTVNVLLGPTLAGKTSLMRLMAGLDKSTSGTMSFDGRDITGLPVRKRSVAMVYQQFINYPTLSVFENIVSPLRVAGLDKAEIEKRGREAAALLRLEPYLQRTPLQLSGGQQQRTAIARALVKGADLVLMDEPLANLDYKLREELREELPRIFGATGSIFVYATTEPTEALLLGGHTATLWEGRVTQFGRTADIYRVPQDLTTAKVLSDPPLNTVSVWKSGNTYRLPDGSQFETGRFAVADGAYIFGFRAHHAALTEGGHGALTLAGHVAVSEITGSESYIHVDSGQDRWVALARGVVKVDPGAPIRLSLDPKRLYLFSPNGALVEAADAALAA